MITILYITSDFRDADPQTPSHLLCSCRITSLPSIPVEDDEIEDSSYGSASDVNFRERKQASKYKAKVILMN